MEENKYTRKDGNNYETVDEKNINGYMDPLFIDYSLLISSSHQSTQELQKFKSALTSWGCFQLINHGIPMSLLDDVRQVSRQFFGLSIEEKQKYEIVPHGTNGFQLGTAKSYISTNTNQVHDWSEGLSLTVFPDHRRQYNFWPEIPLNFKEVLDEYTTKLTAIFDVLFGLVVRSLNVDEERVANKYGKNKEINVRFNFYPRFPGLKQVLGLKPHADFSALTLLLQDEEGLQVLKDEQWFMVPAIPHALFLNLGDPIEIMSNGIYKSAVHRAVTNSEKERVSIAAFWDSDRDKEIGPFDELVTANYHQRYKSISLKDYANTFFKLYQSGKRPIDDVKV